MNLKGKFINVGQTWKANVGPETWNQGVTGSITPNLDFRICYKPFRNDYYSLDEIELLECLSAGSNDSNSVSLDGFGRTMNPLFD